LRKLLDKLTFRLSDSDLEIYFRRIVNGARLPMPLSKQRVNRFEVDFFWPTWDDTPPYRVQSPNDPGGRRAGNVRLRVAVGKQL
jgi:hypothetical protein